MTLFARLRSFMAALVRGRTVEREMEDEWRFHVEARADALAAEGVPRDQAMRQARTEFGDPLRPDVNEICRPFGLHSGVDSIEFVDVRRRMFEPLSAMR